VALAAKRKMESRREEAVESAAEGAIEFVADLAPRDTNRYVRAWIMAARAVGLRAPPLPPLRPSAEHGRAMRRLARLTASAERRLAKDTRAREFWHNVYTNRYERTGRKGRWRNDALRKVGAADRRMAKAAEVVQRYREVAGVLERSPTGVIIWGRRPGKRGHGLSTVPRVIEREFGGTARREVGRNGEPTIKLINREPHARIVERNWRLALRARAMAAKRFRKVMKGRHQASGTGDQ
jgi:PAS domain-containing protein